MSPLRAERSEGQILLRDKSSVSSVEQNSVSQPLIYNMGGRVGVRVV